MYFCSLKKEKQMKFIYKVFILLSLTFLSSHTLLASDYHEQMKLLIYSPRYFGPNAFPIPLLRSGKVSERYEAEVRGEYHYFSGDKTTNLHTRALLPFFRGKAGIEISLNLFEEYTMTQEIMDERYAIERESPITCHGDVIVTAFFQLLKSDKWLDAMVNMTLKTASGGRVCDARYTDAASYWFDLAVGKDLIRPRADRLSLRLQAMVGFYCWMTNEIIHRQNDAILYGAGLTANYRGFTLSTDLSGFSGYKSNGDNSMAWRNNLRYELKKNIISFRYNLGIKDNLYDTLSLGYIRCF